MLSVILGWILVILGIASYAGGLIIWIRSQFISKPEKGLPPAFKDLDLKALAEVLDKLAKALENFAKLSAPVQWALLGLANIGIGAYLMVVKPF